MSAPERPDGVALVTGGTRGIGAAIAQRLRDEGWTVATLARNGAADVSADVSDAEAVQRAFAEVRERFGPVLVLVNNAGVRADGLTIRMPAEDWVGVVDTNLNGAFHCTRRALDDMLKARWGRIVNVSSVVGQRGGPGQANYAAAKAGLLGLTRSIAQELAPRNVTCNVVAPGPIVTAMTEGLSEEWQAKAQESVPLGRFGRPEEVGAAVAFLCSDLAGYVTGALIPVDGGLGMGH
jgi:3-oxoacyl-[acyl-carrier protein] reductase